MAQYMRFDDQDRAALRALDDFAISADGETATVAGEMKVELVRPADDGGQFGSRSGCPAAKISTLGYSAPRCCSSVASKRTNPNHEWRRFEKSR